MKNIGIQAVIRKFSLFIDEKEVQIDEVEALLMMKCKDPVQSKSREDERSDSTTLSKNNKRTRSPRDNKRESTPNKRIVQFLSSSQEGTRASNSKGGSRTIVE